MQEPKETKVYKSKKTFVSFLIGAVTQLALTCIFLILLLAMVTSIGLGLWMQTYKAFTEEVLVAVVEAEERKIDSDDLPYFKITYTPTENPSGLTKIFVGKEDGEDTVNNNGKDSNPKELIEQREEYYIYGDRFMIESEVVNFSDWANILGFKTMYKITRIRGEYTDLELEQNSKRSVYDINGGIDPVWETLEYNQDTLKPFVDGVYGSSVSQSSRKNSVRWNIYMTEDGLIMKQSD